MTAQTCGTPEVPVPCCCCIPFLPPNLDICDDGGFLLPTGRSTLVLLPSTASDEMPRSDFFMAKLVNGPTTRVRKLISVKVSVQFFLLSSKSSYFAEEILVRNLATFYIFTTDPIEIDTTLCLFYKNNVYKNIRLKFLDFTT